MSKTEKLEDKSVIEQLRAMTMPTDIGSVLKDLFGCALGHDWEIGYHSENPRMDSAVCQYCGFSCLRGNRYVTFPESISKRPDQATDSSQEEH